MTLNGGIYDSLRGCLRHNGPILGFCVRAGFG